MYILDSCALRGIFHNRDQYPLLKQRVTSTPFEQLFVSVVSVRENMQWAVNAVRGNERLGRYVQAYSFFTRMFLAHADYQILAFGEEELAIFNELPPETTRIKKADRFIAATAIKNDYTVVTMNTTDFDRIPGCRVQDWSRP